MKKKNDLIYKTFEGQGVHTFIWNGRMCLIGNEVIKILKYSNVSKTLSECIKSQRFEEGIEYKKLRGKELMEFREVADAICPGAVSIKTRNLIILFEPGLYGVLQYSKKPEGIAFGLWIRREVVSELRKKGYYVLGENFKEKEVEKEIVNKPQETKRVTETDEIKKSDLVLAYNLLSLVERAVEKEGIFLESTIQVLKEVGIDIKVKKEK